MDSQPLALRIVQSLAQGSVPRELAAPVGKESVLAREGKKRIGALIQQIIDDVNIATFREIGADLLGTGSEQTIDIGSGTELVIAGPAKEVIERDPRTSAITAHSAFSDLRAEVEKLAGFISGAKGDSGCGPNPYQVTPTEAMEGALLTLQSVMSQVAQGNGGHLSSGPARKSISVSM